jgi:hypothetical protein
VTKTPISDPFASVEFVWVAADGSELPIEARVGRPYLVGRTEWACPCAIEGLDGAYPDIHGEGSVQALCLALGLIHRRLLHILEGGGRLLDPHERASLDQNSLQVIFSRQARTSTGDSD